MVASALVRLPRSWTPLGDNALMRMWTDAVGGSATPLVGGDARFGWNHLGPWVFYLMAVPYRLLGSSAVGLLVGTAVINVVAVLATIRCVRGVAGERAAAIIACGALLFLLTATGNRLIEPWNPYVVQLPFLLALVCCWAVLNRRWQWLPWMVGVGSLCVQSHIAFLVPIATFFVVAAVCVARARWSDTKRAVRRAGVVATVAWFPTLLDLVWPRRHNLLRVARFFVSPSSAPTNGFVAGVNVVLRETGVRASWLGGKLGIRLFDHGFDGGLGLLPGVGVGLLVVAGLIAHRRHDRVFGSLSALLGLLVVAAVVEMAAGRGDLYPYLFGWVTLVGMMCWAVAVLSIIPLLPAPRFAGVIAIAPTALAACLLATGFNTSPPLSPRERQGDASIVRTLVADTEPHLSRTARYHLVHGSDTFSSIYEMGVADELRHDGYHITVEPNAVVLFGRHMTDGHCTSYPALRIVAPFERTAPGEQLLALSDPLNPQERNQEADLVDTLTSTYERAGNPIAASIVRLAEGDFVRFADFAYPDPQLRPLLQQLSSLRQRGRSVAVTLRPPP